MNNPKEPTASSALMFIHQSTLGVIAEVVNYS